jgi:phosphoglycerate kinase
MKSIAKAHIKKGTYVLVRADFNVPVKDGKALDETRIKVAYPTIDLLRKKGARIILLSHIGRDPEETLRPVANVLKRKYGKDFLCLPEVLGERVLETRESMRNGQILLLGNVRSLPGEKAGDKDFAQALAALGDMYVNEAFPVSHRADASIVALPKLLPHFAGLQFEREVKELSRVLKPTHPFIFILGGAKAETKLPLLKRFLKTADTVFVGAILANDFFKAKGYEVGKSKVDEGLPPLGSLLKNKKLILPETVVVEKNKIPVTVSANAVLKEENIFDISVESIEKLTPQITKAKLILWNGPMGWYEGGYTKATEKLLDLLSKTKAKVIIGGGDTSVLVEKKKMAHKFTFVSTGGGATLEFLAQGTLPGIKVLK